MEVNHIDEYKEALSLYKFYHEYRMKILHFQVIFTGVALASVFSYISERYGQILLSIFSMLVTLLNLSIECRSIQLAHVMINHAVGIERRIGFETATKKQNVRSGIPQRFAIRAFYVISILLWLVILVSLFFLE